MSKYTGIMQPETYELIKSNLYLLGIDLNNGVVNNRKTFDIQGYKGISLKSKIVRVHQIIAVSIYGESCIGKQVNHIDGDKTNNRPTNLELVTPAENNKHAYKIGLRLSEKGSKNHFAKLNENQVKQIKKLLKNSGLSSAAIGRMFGVSKDTISLIKRGKTWKHVL